MSTVTVQKSLNIKAAQQTVFDFLTNPAKMSSILSGIFEATAVPELPLKKGSRFNFTYHLGDAIVHGVWKVKKIDSPALYIAETKGISHSTWTHEIINNGETTLVKITFEYFLPTGLISKYKEQEVISLNERNTEQILANLKSALEKN